MGTLRNEVAEPIPVRLTSEWMGNPEGMEMKMAPTMADRLRKQGTVEFIEQKQVKVPRKHRMVTGLRTVNK